MINMKLNKPIKGIFFDLGWTIFYPVNTDWFINHKIIDYVGADKLAGLSKEKKCEVFSRALKYLDDNHKLCTEYEELEQFIEFYSIIAAGLPELNLTGKIIEEAAYSKVFDLSNYIFYEDSKVVLKKLSKSYKLGVISDTWPSEAILKQGGIYDYFAAKTFSCYLGTYKPDERMYLDALTKISLPPEETVFIDDCEENLDGAAKCGIQPILITTNPYEKNSVRYPSIRRLFEIFTLL